MARGRGDDDGRDAEAGGRNREEGSRRERLRETGEIERPALSRGISARVSRAELIRRQIVDDDTDDNYYDDYNRGERRRRPRQRDAEAEEYAPREREGSRAGDRARDSAYDFRRSSRARGEETELTTLPASSSRMSRGERGVDVGIRRSVSGRDDIERDFTRSASPSLRGVAGPRRSASLRPVSSFSRERGGSGEDAGGGRSGRAFERFTDEYEDSPREGYQQRPSRRRRSFFSGRRRDESDDEVQEYATRRQHGEDESYLEGETGDDREGVSNEADDAHATTSTAQPTTAAGASTDGTRTSLFGRLFDMGFPSRDGRIRSIVNLLSPSRFTRRYEKSSSLVPYTHIRNHAQTYTRTFIKKRKRKRAFVCPLSSVSSVHTFHVCETDTDTLQRYVRLCVWPAYVNDCLCMCVDVQARIGRGTGLDHFR